MQPAGPAAPLSSPAPFANVALFDWVVLVLHVGLGWQGAAWAPMYVLGGCPGLRRASWRRRLNSVTQSAGQCFSRVQPGPRTSSGQSCLSLQAPRCLDLLFASWGMGEGAHECKAGLVAVTLGHGQNLGLLHGHSGISGHPSGLHKEWQPAGACKWVSGSGGWGTTNSVTLSSGPWPWTYPLLKRLEAPFCLVGVSQLCPGTPCLPVPLPLASYCMETPRGRPLPCLVLSRPPFSSHSRLCILTTP